MNDYARATGGNLQALPDAPVIKKRPLRELSQREMELIARRRELVIEHMPELVPEIKALVDAGLIDGWRNVQRIEVFETGEVA